MDRTPAPSSPIRHFVPTPGTTPAPPAELLARLGQRAQELGFVRIAAADAEHFDLADLALQRWLAQSFEGNLSYLRGPGRADPRSLMPSARSLLVAALPHTGRDLQPKPSPSQPGVDRSTDRPGAYIARYALGQDYHAVLRGKLERLAQACADCLALDLQARICVDTAPLLEREAARRAGLGFTGKNTLTIVPGFGSYVVLGALIIDRELPRTEPVKQGCGECTACLTACPTGAFVNPYVMDARRCISYLTIESRTAIPRDLRPALGNKVFGCDICQEVCPHNQSPKPRPVAAELAPDPASTALDLVQLLELSSSGYRRLVKGRALTRVSRACLQRNAAVGLGNTRCETSVPALIRALGSRYPLVRQHVVWALGHIGGSRAREALHAHRVHESDADVLEELQHALLPDDDAFNPAADGAKESLHAPAP